MKMRFFPILTLAVLLGALLTACGGGGGSDGPDGSASCLPKDVSGEPDILTAPSFASDEISAGAMVTLNIPVDADTAFVSVNLFSANRSSWAGGVNHTVASPGEQTLALEFETLPGTAANDYFPIINICTDFGSCTGTPGSTGVGIAYATDHLTTPGPDFVRTKYYDNGGIEGAYSETCMPVPYVTVK